MEGVLDAAFESLDAERGFVALVDEDGGLSCELARDRSGREPAAGLSLSRRSSQSQKKGYRSSPGTRSRTVVLPQRRSVREQDIRSAVCVPLPQLRNPGIVYLDQPGLRRPVRRGRPGVPRRPRPAGWAGPRKRPSPPPDRPGELSPGRGAEAEVRAGWDLGQDGRGFQRHQ